jgi:large subunit ribosomal protein L15
MKLNELKPKKGSRKKSFRVGRGEGSGLGKTSGRGGKGQTARKSGPVSAAFEGGQNPIQRRTPKRGFNSHFPTDTQVVNLGAIDKKVKGDVVDAAALVAAGLVKSAKHPIKVLAGGGAEGKGVEKISRALQIKANKFSAKALEAIQAAGGKAEVI